MITCAYCNQELAVDENFAGDSILCANCGNATSIAPDTARTGKPSVSRPQPANQSSSTPQQAYRQALLNSLSPPQGPDELGRLGTYRILQILGVGGMGVVFRAEDTQLKRPVALKTMLPELAADASAKKRFLREAQAAGSIKHNHIVTIFQVSEENGIPFLAMEFLEGESLEDRLNRGGEVAVIEATANTLAGKRPASKGAGGQPLPLAEILRIARQIADGLAAAHERGLIHRDIKPLNIWLESTSEAPNLSTPRGEVLRTPRVGSTRSLPCVKILDFGLARIASEKTQLTEKGDVLGTLAYMAPEQLAGGKVDHRCDLFSLGCTLYRMSTGKLPSALALKSPTPPKDLNPEIPPALSDLVLQLLARDPADRPQTAHEVWERLGTMQTASSEINLPPEPTPLVPKPSAPWAPQTPAPRRRSLLPFVFLALPILIAVALAIAFQQGLFTPAKVDDPNKNIVSNAKPPPSEEPQKNGATIIPPQNNIPPNPNPVEPKKGNGSIKPVVGEKPIEPDHVLKKILERVRAENGSDNVRFLRFFSLHHLLASGVGPAEIAKQRQAFEQALNLLSRKKGLVAPESIDDPDNTIFAVDIRNLGWDERPLQHSEDKKPAELNYFDLILLEYPYGIWSEKSRVFGNLIDDFLVSAKQIRPIVYLRADWLVSVVTSPALGKGISEEKLPEPLGEVLLAIWSPLNMREIAAELDVPMEEARKAAAEMKIAGRRQDFPRRLGTFL